MAGKTVRLHIACLGLAALAFLSGCQVQLHGGLSEDEANLVLAALLDAGLSAEKRPGEEGAFAVFVEETEFAAAVRTLDIKGLPGKRYDDLGTIFGKGAMFSTPLEEKARYLYAMQEELSQTISNIDGVLAARVHLVLPEQDQLGRSLNTPSAAVFVKHVDDERHDPAGHNREIRRLISAGIPNLDEERIVVSFFPAGAENPASFVQPSWKRILGLKVSEESAKRLWMILGGAAGVVLIVVVLSVLLTRKGRK